MEHNTVRRRPKVRIMAAVNGPTRPNSAIFSDTAPEIVAFDQPKACSSGTIRTPGAARTPTEATIIANITPTTTQP